MKIAYDIKLMRPGCAIVQAGFGCDPRVVNDFPSELWLTSPTESMRVYPVTGRQLRKLMAMTLQHHDGVK